MSLENIKKLLVSRLEEDIRIGFELAKYSYPVVIPPELKQFLYQKVNSKFVIEYVERNLKSGDDWEKRYIGWLKEK